MSKKRVVITGLGIISPVGILVDPFWEALKAGESGIKPITHFDVSEFDCRIAGHCNDYDPLKYFNSKKPVIFHASSSLPRWPAGKR